MENRVGLSPQDQDAYNRIIERYHLILNKLGKLVGNNFIPQPELNIHRERFGYCLGLIEVLKGITRFSAARGPIWSAGRIITA
jgi:hypothetical protein